MPSARGQAFAQRWWLPRLAAWRERHPDIAIELHTSQQIVDLPREGFHAALRQGSGQWRGVEAERLLDSPLIAVGSPNAARRLLGRGAAALTDEPLLGAAPVWASWFALAGLSCRVNPVANFNDAGLMLQAAEQDLGLALARKVLVADVAARRAADAFVAARALEGPGLCALVRLPDRPARVAAAVCAARVAVR